MNKLLTTVFAFAVASVTVVSAHAEAIKGDAKAGANKVAMCIGCHGIQGYQASFPEVYKVPKISSQSSAYIVSALTAYKKGERKHPSMKAIAASLTEQDMADLGAFYSTQAGPATAESAPAPTPPATVAELLKKGNCASCHGENLNKPIDPSYPKLAGQHADYLFVALKAYQTEGNPQVGRGNAIMAGMAKPFSHAELKQMASYIASLPTDLKTVPESRFR